MTTDRDFRWCEVSHDYYSRLHQFECAVPKDGVSDARHTYIEGYEARHNKLYPVWQLEVQSAIRDFRKPSNPRSQWAHICVQPDGKGNDRIRSFVWFGIENVTKKDNNGMYIIGYIARSLDAKGCYFGDFTLKHALRICRDDHAKTGRRPYVGVRIDPRNSESIRLFERNGFEDTGPDPEAVEYHRYVRVGFEGLV